MSNVDIPSLATISEMFYGLDVGSVVNIKDPVRGKIKVEIVSIVPPEHRSFMDDITGVILDDDRPDHDPEEVFFFPSDIYVFA